MDWLPPITDPDAWSVLAVKTLRQSQARTPIASQEFTLTGAIALVEASYFEAPANWFQAGWAIALLEVEGVWVAVDKQYLGLKHANLIVLPKVEGIYTLQISFPRWMPQIRLIVRDFVGDDLRPSDQLDRIEQKLDVIN